MDFNFKTITEFHNHFSSEKVCYEFLESLRWEEGSVCPHCGSTKKPYNVKPRGKFKDIPSYRCAEKECDLPFTVRTGSIFQGSKIELKKWLQAAYELSISKKGISSVELGERIGVSQKSAWLINHKLREMLKDTAPELLTGIVEVDETYVGGKESNKHANKRLPKGTTGAKGKTPMVGLLQREGKIVLEVIPTNEANGKTIKPIVRKFADKSAVLYTDGFGAYNGLNKEFAGHNIVKHDKGEYVRGLVHTNSIEGFWALLKRGVVGTFHYVSPQHLQRYCDEFAFRYNAKNSTVCEKFNDTVKRFDTAQITYANLTRKSEIYL